MRREGETDQVDDIGLHQSGVVLHGGRQRERLIVKGADRVRFLQGIVTGNVEGTPVGGGCRSTLLTPKGHVVTDMFIFVHADEISIVVDAGQGDATAAALSRYAIMDDVAISREAGWVQLAVLGPKADEAIRAAGLVPAAGLPASLLAHVSDGPLWIVRVHELGADGYWIAGLGDVLTARQRLEEKAGVRDLSEPAAEAARIRAFEPRWGAEITPDYFPMEVGLSAAIDYSKGCYLGQEPIVRLRDRGHINWRLVQLEIAGDVDPAPGDKLGSDAKPKAGKVTSVARGVALGMLHVSVPVGADVRIEHAEGVLQARVIQSV